MGSGARGGERGARESGQLGESVGRWIGEMSGVLDALDQSEVVQAIEALREVQASDGTIFTCGNGGSASTASHLALDLQKAARGGKRRTRAHCLSDSVGLITAWANDHDFAEVFAQQLDVLGKQGDALVVVSVSGSSPNLMRALETARERHISTVGLLGKNGGAALGLCDHPVVVRSDDYGWVESVHVVLHHVLTNALRDSAGSL